MRFKSKLLVLMLLLTIAIVGCENKEKIENKSNTTQVEQTVNSFLSQIKAGQHKDAINDYVKGDTSEVIKEYERSIPNGLESIIKAQTSKLEYEIISSEVKDKVATVTTKIKSPSMEEIMNQSIFRIGQIMLNGKTINENINEIANVIIPKINDPSIKKYENIVDIKLTYNEQDKKWYINKDEEMLRKTINSVLGNIEEVMQKLKNIS